MGKLLVAGAAGVLVFELLRLGIQRLGGRPRAPATPSGLKAHLKQLFIRTFTVLTFPLVVLISLAAALSLLPYVLLCKPYRVHLKEVRERQRQTEKPMASPSAFFPWQFSELDVTDFLSLPFRLAFAFMDRVERGPQALKPGEEPQQEPRSKASAAPPPRA